MGFIDRLREGLFRVRVVPKQDITNGTSFTSDKDSVPEQIDKAIDSGKRVDLSDLTKIGMLKGNRDTKYKIFEEMVADGRIGAAVEMYANDTVQYNNDGKVIWIESEDTDVAAYATKLLNDLSIPENIWSYAYCMWLYGDVYLELFKNTSTDGSKPGLLLEPVKQNQSVRSQVKIPGARLERYIEKVANPVEVYDLQYKGKTAGFVRSKDEISNTMDNNAYLYTGTSTDIDILNPTKFVHICLSPNINRFPEKFRLLKEEPNKTTEDGYIDGSSNEEAGTSLTFSVKTGQSILENVYSAYQTLKLKEESILLERITKSSITRVVQVELGDLPESQKIQKLTEIKNQIEQQLQMNKDAGTINSRPGMQASENIIYTATRNGKGTISTTNIGGDAEIGNTDDVNQSENKVYGALLTPKALLGADMEGSGLSNGGSLTEMNTTYARRIKRGQVALCTAIQNLIDIFALSDGLGDKIIGKFTVKLTPIVTVEDNRRDELMQNKIRNVSEIISLFDGIEEVDNSTKLEMLIKWLSNYLNQQDIVDILNEQIKELEQKEKEKYVKQAEEMIDGDDSEDTTPSEFKPNFSTTPSNDIDLELNEPEKPELEVSNDINLSDIEGEDLL